MKKQRTFVMVKPDGVQRGLVGEIINRFEKKGLKIIAMKMVSVSKELAEKHYGVHKGKSFFKPTVKYITSSPVVAMILEGYNAIDLVRNMMGKTNPADASSGSIRGDFGQFIGRNIVHGSDGPDTAEFEISLWFKDKEISNYTRIDEEWLVE